MELTKEERAIILNWYRAKNRYYSLKNIKTEDKHDFDELNLLRRLMTDDEV